MSTSRVLNFYMDDSGTRTPNRQPLSYNPKVREFFALGGVLVNEEDEAGPRKLYSEFCARWSINYPLHSVEIRHSTGKLRVMPERSSKADEARLERYYTGLRTNGPPFEKSSSAGYAPLTPAEFAETLHEIRFKSKSSPMGQAADLFLWPIALAGYEPNNRAYVALRDAGRLIESRLSANEIDACGSKYSCFELVRWHQRRGSKTTKAQTVV